VEGEGERVRKDISSLTSKDVAIAVGQSDSVLLDDEVGVPLGRKGT
jgi:hypothetical protein